MNITEILSANPAVLALFAFILGAIVGSFLNVVIYRLPVMMEREWIAQCSDFLEVQSDKKPQPTFERFNLAVPASHCPSCRHPISAMENIPLFSFLIQQGKCKHCRTDISLRYPAVEVFTGLLSGLAVFHFGYGWASLVSLALIWSLVVLSMIDYDHQLLPDDITLPLLWIGLIANGFGLFTDLESAIWGAVGGYLILWGVYWLFRLLTGREGMGHGDFKLLAALGAWLGWQALPLIILLSSLLGAIVGLALILMRGRDKNVPIPFGPWLACAGYIALIWGEHINEFYLRGLV